MFLHPLQRIDPFRGGCLGGDRQLHPQRLHVGEREHPGGIGVGEHAASPAVVARPDPPRHFEPRTLRCVVDAHGEFRHRPPSAAHLVGAAVGGERFVVGLMELSAVREQPAHEHHDGRQPHHLAHRQLERLPAESLLERVAGLRQRDPEPRALRRPLDGQRPPPAQDRIGLERREQVGGPLAERGEQFRIDDAPLLPGHLRGGRVKRHRLQPRLPRRAHGHADARRHAAVGIDDEVDRRAADGAGIAVERRILEPDAGVEELRLVASHHDRPRDPVGHIARPVHVAVARRVFRGDREHLAARGGDELPELQIADPRVEGGPQEPIVVDERLDAISRCVGGRVNRRVDQAVAGCGGGFVDAAEWKHVVEAALSRTRR